MKSLPRRVLFVLFFVSGFCALVYQVVWTRLAFASFGVIMPVLSVVISIFMLGLTLGSWLGGKWIRQLCAATNSSAISWYAAGELMIGIGAFAVPKLFAIGDDLLLSSGDMDSFRYLLFSAFVLALSILPWCVFMGATYPFMMAYVREWDEQSTESFSFLYAANVLGAMTGTLLTAVVLVEILGFRHTLWFAAAGNFSIVAIAGALALQGRRISALPGPGVSSAANTEKRSIHNPRMIKSILFSTGFCAMAMEVVWVRSFTPFLQTQVYAFALILFTYLGATFLGSIFYRRHLRRNRVRSIAALSAVLAVAVFLPILLNDAGFFYNFRSLPPYVISAPILMLSICPLCAALGYLTPSLIDTDALGEPSAAGKAYAVNVLGCILGPLFASYILLPWFGERYGLVLLGAPFLLFYFLASKTLPVRVRISIALIAILILCWSIFFTVDFARFALRRAQAGGAQAEIRRDYAASVIALGEGQNKHLLVNGVGMTALIPATKFMVHLPLMLHTGKAESALIVCFGMGTSFRSALSWDVKTTAVELVPSVKNSFAFYHADAAQVLKNPKGRIVIDDGRRYLNRTNEKFDVIVIDPPPPVPAAGSSLLYSEEFYETAKRHLKPYGILQAWFPNAERATEQAIVRSVRDSFPYLQCFRSPGEFGTHILASMEPISVFNPGSLASAMPLSAATDLLEWSSTSDLTSYITLLLSKPLSTDQLLNPDPTIRVTDDRPYNEYFLLRQWAHLKFSPGSP
jgi:spermidine synthase